MEDDNWSSEVSLHTAYTHMLHVIMQRNGGLAHLLANLDDKTVIMELIISVFD